MRALSSPPPADGETGAIGAVDAPFVGACAVLDGGSTLAGSTFALSTRAPGISAFADGSTFGAGAGSTLGGASLFGAAGVAFGLGGGVAPFCGLKRSFTI